MKRKSKNYSTVTDFGKALGLSEIDMKLVRQKKKLIEKLKATRIKKKISQAQLAELVGSNQPSIARMESGLVAEVSLDFLAKIALALDITITIKNPA